MDIVERAQTEREGDTRLSYSSASLLSDCEQKYWHKKIGKTKMDPDYEDNFEALNLGKAFHQVLEVTNHLEEVGKYTPELIKAACEDNKCPDKLPLVTAMCNVYGKMHRESGLKVYRCELGISDSNVFVGYIDAIMTDEKNGGWWIVDNKTSGRWDPAILARLARDTQLNLYSFFAVEKSMGLIIGVPGKFLGARYRVTTKSTSEMKAKETPETYVSRLETMLKSLDVVIPVSLMAPKEIWSEHEDLWYRAKGMREGSAPTKNFRNCLDKYNKQCPWWSQCHKKTFTDCKGRIEVFTIGAYNQSLEDLI